MTKNLKIKYRIFTRPEIGKDLELAWKNLVGSRARRGNVLAFSGTTPVGLFQYNIEKADNKIFLIADGTVVLEAKQKNGIGKEMWTIALKKERPNIVQVCATSLGGTKLITSVKKKFPKITWDTW